MDEARTRFAPLAALAIAGCLLLTAPLAIAAEDDGWATSAQPLLQQYCWSCHGGRVQKSDLDLQRIASPAELDTRPELLAELSRRVSAEEMPPSTAPQPTAAERATLVRWLRDHLAGSSGIADDPGTVVMPRATPTQYERIIKDLTGVDMPLAGLLPRDGGAGEGFDNVGAAQAMTPMHLQAYLLAAKQVIAHARILPERPIEWSPASRLETRTTAELYTTLLFDYREWFRVEWPKLVDAHLETLRPVLPNEQDWQKSTNYQTYDWKWLIPYLHAAWQHRHRAELGHPEWTPQAVAEAYQPPLRGEVLTHLVTALGMTTDNIFWQKMVSHWEALPPPPVPDHQLRDQCLGIVNWIMHNRPTYNGLIAQNPETPALLPGEVDPETITRPGGSHTLMKLQGLRPFRFELKGRRELWLVTTDAGDGNEDDVMIWEKGVIVRDGHEAPWTAADVREGDGSPVLWGTHPMGAPLPKDSIAVHAPAVLHITFPEGTTAFSVDARADPVYAKDGSMQPAPLEHAPSADELHCVCHRFVVGAPGSKRQALQNKWSIDFNDKVNAHCGYTLDFRTGTEAYIPPEVRTRWGIKIAPTLAEAEFCSNAKFNQNPWQMTGTLTIDYAPAADVMEFSHRVDQLRGTIEARDALIAFLTKQKIPFADAAAALAVAPAGLTASLTEQHEQLLAAARADEQRLLDSARAHIAGFAERAWRQVPPEAAVSALLAIYQRGRDQGLCYQAAVKPALLPILVSPDFLYRLQYARHRDAPYALAGRELAERLAAVVWGSIPDAELLRAADAGELDDAPKLALQIQRLIADPRARGLAAEFAGQAFRFAGFDHVTGPDRMRFPQFTNSVRDAMYQECLCFFANLVQQDRPLTEIIDADYTFVNQELAAFYGLPGVKGPEFRRVEVDRAQRGGILGMGAILVASSQPLRTSPIRRGFWVLAQLLGTPPPPPPAVVPQISSDDHDEQGLTIVQQMQRHRSDPRCMSCHERMDPLGVALESFDAIGRRRAKMPDGGQVLEQETAVDGTMIQGLTGLKAYLMRDQQRDKVMRNLCVKFTGYALGRGLLPSDEPLIDRLMADLEAKQWRSSALLLGVLTSPQFLQRRDEDVAATKPASASATEKKP